MVLLLVHRTGTDVCCLRSSYNKRQIKQEAKAGLSKSNKGVLGNRNIYLFLYICEYIFVYIAVCSQHRVGQRQRASALTSYRKVSLQVPGYQTV